MDANRIDLRQTLGEPRVLVSRKALLHNAQLIRARLSPGVKLCATIKADAYGHGAAIVADTLFNLSLNGVPPPADALALASLDEAAALSAKLEPVGQVMILRPLENAFLGRQRVKIEEAIRRGWVMTVCSAAAAEDLARIAFSIGRQAVIQVMVDTGMTRSGVTPERLPALLEKIDQRASLKLVSLCTHFASSEEAGGTFTAEQMSRFDASTRDYAATTHGRVIRHAANSGAVFLAPQTHLDLVRPGIGLLGVDPTGRPSMDRPLKPVLRWVAPLVGIQHIAEGTTVGYGQAWTARRPTRVGLLPVGYADGYPRQFGNKAVVVIHGHAAPVIGRVSMDLMTIDLTDAPHATIGDDVTLLDDDPLSPASVYQLAKWADTIPYEIFCGIGPRVHRVAIDEEEPAAGDSIDSPSAEEMF